ncbi:uncharacterized protein TNCV_4095211 [Trichonephila clavipes]|uniref:Tc1-like transposase DDE domain-containing protein n=1 Tax=Trichonephila clavipes TaxID=2585209 RepID=A0A8X6S8I8_TRICX|nr:uncharacterized protein TNCV_4095211 [Trichonephila clavipes]
MTVRRIGNRWLQDGNAERCVLDLNGSLPLAAEKIGILPACVRYISGVLRPVALPFIRAHRKPTFQQDNAQTNITSIVRTFRDTENVRLLPWPARSPDLSPLENVWSMAFHHTPVTTVDEL